MLANLNAFLQKGIIKNFFIYTIGAIFLKGVSFLLIPVYTKVLTPEEFGQLELITTITAVLGILLSYGLPQLVFIEYFHLKKEEKFAYINQIISVYFIAATPAFIVLYVLLLNLNLITIYHHKFLFITFALLSSYFLFFQTIFFSILQLEKQALILTKYKVLAGIGVAFLNIVLVYFLRLGVIGILFTNFAVLIFSLFFAFPRKKNKLKFSLNLDHLNKSQVVAKIKKGFPYIISSLSFWMIAAVDRWIILLYLDQHSVGIYSVAYKFAVVYEPLLIAPILNVYSPYIFEKFKNNDLNQQPFLIIGATLAVFLFLSVGSFGIALFMVNQTFSSSLTLIPLLVLGFSFTLLAQVFGCLMVFFNKSKLLIQNVFISSFVNIVANVILIKHYELAGAAYAFLLSNFVWFALTFYQNSKLKKELQVSFA